MIRLIEYAEKLNAESDPKHAANKAVIMLANIINADDDTVDYQISELIANLDDKVLFFIKPGDVKFIFSHLVVYSPIIEDETIELIRHTKMERFKHRIHQINLEVSLDYKEIERY